MSLRFDGISFLPRFVHRAWAGLGGYFWLPCDLCGRYSGGHERDTDDPRSRMPVPGEPGHFRGVCPACTRANAVGCTCKRRVLPAKDCPVHTISLKEG